MAKVFQAMQQMPARLAAKLDRAGLEPGNQPGYHWRPLVVRSWATGRRENLLLLAIRLRVEDYSCLPGLGVNAYLSTGGDAFYFPKIR
jgi:hypothetical protein